MDGIVAKLTGTIITTPEVHQTAGGLAWTRFSVSVDSDHVAEIVVRVNMQGPDVPALAPCLVVGARVFCMGRLSLRSWKNDSGVPKVGLTLAARKVAVCRERRLSKVVGG